MSCALSFRPLGRCDFPLFERWLAEPHVAPWWRDLDASELELKYGPYIDGTVPVHMFIIEHEGRAVGWIQWYLWKIDPEEATCFGAPDDSAGIDLVIGEHDMIGRGVGPACICQFLDEHVFVNPAIRSVVTDPEADNARSVRAFQKAGFITSKITRLPGENIQRNIMKLDRSDSRSIPLLPI